MVDVIITGEEMGWVTGYQDIRLYLADGTDNFPAQVHARNQVAILQVQKTDRFDSDDGGGSVLFGVAGCADLVCGGVDIIEAFVAAGQQEVMDLVTCPGPASQSGSTEKFRVIRMSQDDQDFLGFLPFVGSQSGFGCSLF